jgi:predicted nucleic acid-binding protein
MDQARVQSFLPQLDLGEAEAIVLAIETKAEHLLVDERRGRAIAAKAGVRPGTRGRSATCQAAWSN